MLPSSRSRSGAALAATLLVAVGAPPAHAEPAPTSLRVEVGLGTGVDSGYLSFGWRARPELDLSVGVGVGMLGVDVNVAPRLVLRDGRTRILAGLGAALSVAAADSSLDDSIPVLWLTADAVLARRLGAAWYLWLSAGATVWMSAPDQGCECWFDRSHTIVPIATIGLGHDL